MNFRGKIFLFYLHVTRRFYRENLSIKVFLTHNLACFSLSSTIMLPRVHKFLTEELLYTVFNHNDIEDLNSRNMIHHNYGSDFYAFFLDKYSIATDKYAFLCVFY